MKDLTLNSWFVALEEKRCERGEKASLYISSIVVIRKHTHPHRHTDAELNVDVLYGWIPLFFISLAYAQGFFLLYVCVCVCALLAIQQR